MKCSFCGKEIAPGRARIVVKDDGNFLTFCSSKCERNMLGVKRSPQKVKWTENYHEEKKIKLYGKEKKAKKKEIVEEKKAKKKKLSKKERREIRKRRKEEKKIKKKSGEHGKDVRNDKT